MLVLHEFTSVIEWHHWIFFCFYFVRIVCLVTQAKKGIAFTVSYKFAVIVTLTNLLPSSQSPRTLSKAISICIFLSSSQTNFLHMFLTRFTVSFWQLQTVVDQQSMVDVQVLYLDLLHIMLYHCQRLNIFSNIAVGLEKESFDAAKYANKKILSSSFSSGFFKRLTSITACSLNQMETFL